MSSDTKQQGNNKQQQFQTITRSPDSKRCKWEIFNGNDPETMETKSSKKVFDFLAGKYSQLERENTERIGNSLYLELKQPDVLNSDDTVVNKTSLGIESKGSDGSSSIIMNIKKSEISKYQTV